MCSSHGESERGVLAMVDQALEALRAAGRVPLGGAVSDVELTQLVQRLTALERIAAGQRAGVVREIEQRQAHRGQAAGSAADLLARTLRLTPGEARRESEFADGLAVLPDTQAALADGRIGIGHAEVAVKKAAEVKDREDAELLVKQIDAVAASVGQVMDRNRLAREIDAELAKFSLDVLAERERTAFQRRSLSWTVRDGMHVLHAELDAVGGSMVRAVLDSLSDKTGEADTRSFSHRQADALVQMAAQARNADDAPKATLQSSRVLLTVTPEALHGVEGAQPAVLDGHGPVSIELARQLCCDAEVTAVSMTRNHEVLDAGRTRRLPTARQRAAVIARDRACIGCGAPVSHCQIHHIRWWDQHRGPTDEDNLALVCWRCHTHIHQHQWQITRGPDGRYRAGPPNDMSPPHLDNSRETERELVHTG